jgi:adenylate cyclase
VQIRDPVILLLAAALVAALVVVVLLTRRLAATRRELEAARRATVQAPQYSSRTVTAAHRAVRTAVSTAARVRDQGMAGLLMSSIDDLTRWALEDRPEIARIAAPDGTVTIFFSDIEGSTALNERLGDEAFVKLLAAHDRLLRAHVETHHGHVVKSQGDGFMIVFRTPADAARAGLAVQRALAAGGGRALRRTPVSVRIGLHTGPVVARDGDYFGRNVAMAARVAAEAAGGQLLVSDDVQAALQDTGGFGFRQQDAVELKGLPGTHRLWQLTRR